MRVEVIMPRMGQGMEEGTILQWLKPVGALVKRGDSLIEIESDKATVEIEAFATGRLSEIAVQAGESALIGAVLAYIEVEERTGVPATPAPTPTPASSEAQREARRIPISPVADRLAHEHGLDTATLTGTGPSGRITKEDVETAVAARQSSITQALATATDSSAARLDVSPVAKRLAKEHLFDLRMIVGSAPNGRIIKRDIDKALAQAAVAPAVPVTPAAPSSSGQRQPLSRLRRLAARRMVESKQQIPHFYLTLDVPMERALQLRESLKKRGKAVSVNDLVLKAAALALGQYPTLNATYAGDDLLLNKAVNLAIAVAVGEKARPEGLTTPVIHGCEALTLAEIGTRAAELAGKARAGKLTPDDLSGATFTVSNLGMFGIRQFQAIINPPQVAILAVGALQKVAVFDANNQASPVQQMAVTLSADHRATDGAEAAGFLATFRDMLEDAFVLAE